MKAKLQGLALQFLCGREELVRDGCHFVPLKQAWWTGSVIRFETSIIIRDYTMQPKGEMRVQKYLVIGVGNCQRTIRKI